MHLLLRRADRGVHRRRDDRGNHLRERRLRGHHREHRERRRRGNHRHHRRRRDVRPERHRDDRDDLLRDRDVPNGSAWHRGWGEEASSPGSDEVRPGPVRDGAHPGREPDECHRTVLRDGVHPVREPAVRHRGAEHRVRDGEPVAPREPRSTGCYRHAEPWGRAWGRDLLAWELPGPGPVQRRWSQPTRPEPARPERRALRAKGSALPGPEPVRLPELRAQRELPPPELALRVLPALPDGVPASGRDGVRPVSLRPASRCCLQRDRPLRDRSVQLRRVRTRPHRRTGRIHEVDVPLGLRLWMMRT